MPKQLACEFWTQLYYLFNMIRMADETDKSERFISWKQTPNY